MFRNRSVLALAVSLTAFTASVADAQVCLPDAYFSGIPGSRDIAVINDTTILTTTYETWIWAPNHGSVVDISDPANPIVLDVADAVEFGVKVRGSLAYFHDFGQLRIVDISDTSSIQTLGMIAGSLGNLYSKRHGAFMGDNYFVLNSFNGSDVDIIDVSNPNAPAYVSTIDTDSIHHLFGIGASDSYIYAATWDGLKIIDATNPAMPQVVGTIDPGEFWSNTHVHGNRLYGLHDGALRVLDITSPATPTEIASIPGIYSEYLIDGDRLISPIPNQRYGVFDISDLSNPVQTNTLVTTDSTSYGIALAGELLLTTTVSRYGTLAQDISATIADLPQDTGIAMNLPTDVVVENRAYGFRGSTLEIRDVSNPVAPILLSSYPVGFIPSDFDLQNGRIAVAGQTNGVVLIDVADPSDPSLIASFDLPASDGSDGDIRDVALDDDTLYAVISDTDPDFPRLLTAVDISNPTAPVEITSILSDDVNASYFSEVAAANGNIGLLAARYDIDLRRNVLEMRFYERTPANTLQYSHTPIVGYSGRTIDFRVNGDQLFFMYAGSNANAYLFDLSSPGAASMLIWVQPPGNYYFYGQNIDGPNYDDTHQLLAATSSGNEFFAGVTGGRVLRFEMVTTSVIPILKAVYQVSADPTDLYVIDDTLVVEAGTIHTIDLTACDNTCLPDVNGDGFLNGGDFTAWINAFSNNLPECDQNQDGTCTPTDFNAWIANFNAGC